VHVSFPKRLIDRLDFWRWDPCRQPSYTKHRQVLAEEEEELPWATLTLSYVVNPTGLPWGLNFNPHTHPIPIPMGIPMGIPIPTAALQPNRRVRHSTMKTIETSAGKVNVSHAAVKSFDRHGVSCKNARTVQFSGGVENCPVTQKTALPLTDCSTHELQLN